MAGGSLAVRANDGMRSSPTPRLQRLLAVTLTGGGEDAVGSTGAVGGG